MKNQISTLLFVLLTVLFGVTAGAKEYYCSPTGNDSNPGTIDQPFATWEKLGSVLVAGDIGYVRGGTYRTTKGAGGTAHCRLGNKSGTASNYIKLWAYPGEFPVLNLDNIVSTATSSIFGVIFENGSYWHIKGLRISNFIQRNGNHMPFGFYATNGTGNILEQCESDHNGYGFNLDKQINMQVINCDAHHNQDPYSPSAYDGSDGFGLNGGQPANTSITFTGCRAWWNCDDGWDLFRNNGLITFNDCWAFWNGYIPGTFTSVGNGDGFKVGPTDNTDLSTQVKRILNRCVAFQNKFQGFDQNDGMVISQLYNCTSYGNGGIGFHFSYQSSLNIKHILKNNISFQDKSPISSTPSWVQSNNTWNGLAATANDFASLTNTGVDGPRQADGSLPNLQFLHLSASSNLIDKGIGLVSILFNGSAPDLGAYEYGGTSSAVNQPPVANAGTDQNITLPTSAVTLNGIGTDADGSISAYQWTKIAGPTQYTIASPAAAKTVLSNLAQGVYQFELQVTDNSGASDKDTVQVTVNAAANQLPVANAGNNQTITLPANSVTLDGSSSKDADGSISSYAWSKVSGPSQGSITNAGSVSTTATNLVQGTYVFKLIVTDNSGATGSDSVTITVNGIPNQPPVANAGGNKTITLPTNSVTLDGSASSDADGTISSYAWTKSSGPVQGTVASASSATTNVTNLAQGTYVFKLTVKDNSNATAVDSVTITVNGIPNQPPVANAGGNKTITLPTNSVTLDGSASSDADGTISSYAWTKSSGPAQGTIVSASSATTNVTNLAQGTYVFKLTVKDNSNATALDSVVITVNAAANQPPVANAGGNKTITLPANSITLDGSASSDADGTISSYTWTKSSGPAQGTIVSASSATTNVTNLAQGTYVFKLTVKDNSNATALDSVVITVNAAANQPPVANAGSNQVITLPANSATLDGSASIDADGSIVSYVWTKTAGGTAVFSNAGISSPTVSNLQEGQYTFELIVTDNNGASSSNTVKVTVVKPTDKNPVANAGPSQTITLPVNSTSLNGDGSSDPDGVISSYNWSKISGPAQGSIVSSSQSITAINNLIQGVYTFKLTVTDNNGGTSSDSVDINVNAAANQPPVANAGSNQNITLPVNTINLDGSASTDADGSIVSYKWVKISGGAGSIANDAVAKTTVSGLVAGQYTFELTVTDNKGAASKAQIKVTVNAAANQPPVANAGSNQNITLPVNTISLDGSASTDADGSIVSYKWVKISGGAGTIANDAIAKTTVSGLVAGQYTFELTVTDNKGAASKAQIKVTVNAAANQPPVANAGSNQNITLPMNTINLDGSASTDADGSIVSYKWVKISGGAGSIANDAVAKTTVSGLVAGQYTFELTVTDNKGGASKAQIKVTVNAAANQPPVANAGSNQNITLPMNTINLDGSASTDADGSIVSYKWVKISGGAGTIASDAVAKTTVSGLVAGQYTFELTVTDDKGAASKVQIKVTVNVAVNQPPVANAGSNQNITLPVNTINLDGSASSDADGSIVSYKWVKISGGAGTIASDAVAKTTVSGLVAGQYTFELTVTDNKGATSKAQIKVTVNAAVNQSPVANAGINQTLSFGTQSVTLDGSKSSDPDGTIVAYKWTLVTGNAVTVSDSSITKPVITGLQGGQYIFELTVTDDKGASSNAQVKIIVNLSSNQPPVANAGSNQVIVLPVSSTKLDATRSSDPDGTIVSFNWTKIDGPSAITITNVNTSTPIIDGLIEGQYTFELTVTDNRGASTKAQVKVTVQEAVGNKPPVADAGTDQTITLPPPGNGKLTNGSVKLDGNGSYDPDGTIVSYSWMKLDGASAVTISNVNTATPTVSGLKAGIYTFELKVTDNAGVTTKDQVTIFVNPAPENAPYANAGEDRTIVAPESTATLDGSGSYDSQGNISYKWEQEQGPAASSFSTSTTSKITVKDLEIGEYVFKLTVTNSLGIQASDEVKVIVAKAENTAQVDLYPNPASDLINAKISSDSIGVVVLNIYDLNGKAVKKVELSKQLIDNLRQQVQRRDVNNTQPNTTQAYFTLPVNIASLGKGVYILETIIDKRIRVASKFVKY